MITEDILDWVATLPRWQKKLGYLIIEKKHVTEDVLEDIYGIFKIEKSLEDGEIVDSYTHTCVYEPDILPVVKWHGVGNLHGVNRLKSESELSISDGLTVIYGENGSGKSGYTRLLNRAFVSRGDQEILHNIFSDSKEDVSADFKFCIDGNQVVYKYPEKKGEFPFETIRIFDSKSASDDMNRESTIDFAPSELSFFDMFLSACVEIQKKLDGERVAKKLENPAKKFFPNKGEALSQIEALSANSEVEKIRENFAITEEEKGIFEQIKTQKANLIALDINRQIVLINQVLDILNDAIIKYQQFKEVVSKDKINIYNHQIDFLKKCRKLHDTDGMMLLEKENIELIGTMEWKDFIISSKKYYDAITNHNKCPLCGNEIEEKDLIYKYWKYLESDAASNLKVAKEAIRISEEGLNKLDFSFLVESSVQEQWLLENFREEVEAISLVFKTADGIRKQLLQDLENESTISVGLLPELDIQGLITRIMEKKSSLNQDSINEKIADCDKKESEYMDKSKVIELLPIITTYIDYLKWDAIAEKSKIKTRGITNKQTELFEKYVTDDYLKTFEQECKKLSANFNVEVVSRGSSGQTFKKLQIKGTAPGKVLSEGEQRAISIASFLTEVHMDARNIGIVLDDPVCSLDHKRRSLIVKPEFC